VPLETKVKTAQPRVKELPDVLVSPMDAANQSANHALVAQQVAAVLMANASAQTNKQNVFDLYCFYIMYSK